MYEPLAHHPHQMAHGLASLGRGGDSMLVHMSPQEVGGLHQLARAMGGSVTTNPHTGLPEAGFLSSFLPLLAGAAVTFMSGGTLGPAAMMALQAGAGMAAGAASGQRGWGLALSGLGGVGGGSLAAGLSGAGAAGTTATTSAVPASATGNMADAVTNAAQATGTGAQGAGTVLAPEAVGTNTVMQQGAQGVAQTAAATPGAAPATAFVPGEVGATQTAAAPTLSNAGQGLKGLATPQGQTAASSEIGKTGMGTAIGTRGVALASLSPMITNPVTNAGIPDSKKQDPKFYNATYDPKTQTYKNANWTTQFGGQGYTGTRGTGGLNGLGGAGTYADPYTAVTAVPTQGMASGGSTSAPADQSHLKDYYTSLMNGSATTSSLPSISAEQNQSLMPQSWAPNPQFEQQALAASQPAATTTPTKTATPNTTPSYTYPVTNSAGKTTTASIPSLVWNPSTQSYGPGTGGAVGTSGLSGLASMINASGMPGAAGIGGLGSGTAVPGYTWDPVTQSYTTTPINGMANRVVGGGKAYGGAINAFAGGGLGAYSDGGNLLRGPGDGVSDSIPAQITGPNPQKAALADGEFVLPARIVSEIGNGSTDAGAKKLYAMMDRIQQNRSKTTGKNKVAVNSHADKLLLA